MFFDASCLIAAAGSLSGGSAFLLEVCARGFLRAVVSEPVLLEAERNVSLRLAHPALANFHAQLRGTGFTVVSVPLDVATYENLVNPKDAHVVAATVGSTARFLLTLDQGLQREVNASNLEVSVFSPGDFIRQVLPTHTDFFFIR